MVIKENTPMILFRYNNYKKRDFIKEHKNVLKNNNYVWLLKLGKKSNVKKIEDIKNHGGYLLLRAPKSDGGKTYITKFIDTSESEPKDGVYPEYYNEILDEDNYIYWDKSLQWFKIKLIKEFNNENMEKIVLSNGKKPVNEIIDNTMTAFMFVENSSEIVL